MLDGEQELGLVRDAWLGVTPFIRFINCLGGTITLYHWYCDHLACIPGGEYRASVVPGMIDLPVYTPGGECRVWSSASSALIRRCLACTPGGE